MEKRESQKKAARIEFETQEQERDIQMLNFELDNLEALEQARIEDEQEEPFDPDLAKRS